MMSVAKLRDLLAELERRVLPASGAHHAVMHLMYGSDEVGWEHKLGLQMNCGGVLKVVFFDEDDFDIEVPALVELILGCL